MASATATRSPERRASRRRGWLPGSRIGRLILSLNLLALAVLVGGALILNELRRGLVEARVESLTAQGGLISNIIERGATEGEPEPYLDENYARELLLELFIPSGQRARLFAPDGDVIADSDVLAARVRARPLPPARSPGEPPPQESTAERREAAAWAALQAEVARVTETGQSLAQTRVGPDGRRLVSVSLPIQHVRAVLGVLTIEAGDVDAIIAAERRALLPFILVAVAVILVSSLLLNQLVGRPITRLAQAADRVRTAQARAISLPDLSRRHDELGELTQSLEAMTDTLSSRMDAIESFAADVAHEIRNPLTSIRSAVETLELDPPEQGKRRLMGILKHDVGRLDRLITDIANASRLDAELSRDSPRPVDLSRLLAEIVGLYNDTLRPKEPRVSLTAPEEGWVIGREGPLGQVARNLIDNARSFSPAEGEVRVSLTRDPRGVRLTVDDDGPGLPPENLETVFERFYTSRPKGAAFGGNSGLGLSIARQIVDAHGGRIWAENRIDDVGQVLGARFQVVLPAAR
jgi:two-component system, OmpR family, sensor histidine kinase ChvG